MDKIRRLFQRSELESQEVNILRGFLTSLDNYRIGSMIITRYR